MYDQQGCLLLIFSIPAGSNNGRFDISNYPDGIYLIKIRTKNSVYLDRVLKID
jgi:hypothetical protein